MTLITLDFETYFDSDYTLSKLTTEAYIRNPRFEALCMGWKWGNNPAFCVPPNAFPNMFLPINTSGVVCHHAHFDGLILSHHYNLKPYFWFDTLSMARCAFPHDKSHSLASLAAKFDLGHKTVPYELFKGLGAAAMPNCVLQQLMDGCAQDVELTHQIFKKLLPLVPKEELKIIDMTVRMFTEPMLKLDRDRAQTYMNQLVARQDELLSSLGVSRESLRSADKFAAILEDLGVDPPTKISPRTGKVNYAFAKTDQGFLELVNSGQESISLLCEARLSSKSTIGETRAGRLIGMSERGDLPVYLKYFGAHTGRWSGGDKLNFQNFPRGGELRKSLVAPEGYVLVVVDSAQIECRMLNWLARETWVLEAFRGGRDLYCEMATDFYNRTITKNDKMERFLGKTLVLGAGYGVGDKKLRGILKLGRIDLDENEAKRAIQAYRRKHINVVNLWKEGDWILRQMYKSDADAPFKFNWGPMIINHQSIVMPNGIVLDYSNLAYDGKDMVLRNPKGTVKIYGGKLVENCLSGDTLVLTNIGWKKIKYVTKNDLLWDGVEWVCHDGLVCNGQRLTKELDGVRLTPEHKVLTSEGWKNASSSQGYNRASIGVPYSYSLHRVGRDEVLMGIEMRLREENSEASDGVFEGQAEVLRVQTKRACSGSAINSRDVATSGILGLAKYESQMHEQEPRSMEKLRRARDNSLQTMVGKFRELLGRYGADVSTWVRNREEEQQSRIQPQELHLGDQGAEHSQQEKIKRRCGGIGKMQSEEIDSVLPDKRGMAGTFTWGGAELQEQVYDIMNSGPRNRFTVLGNNGPFIVHNCVQSLSRIVISQAMLKLGAIYKIITMSHDELVYLAPEGEADMALEIGLEFMKQPPEWCGTLPLGAEGGYAKEYSK